MAKSYSFSKKRQEIREEVVKFIFVSVLHFNLPLGVLSGNFIDAERQHHQAATPLKHRLTKTARGWPLWCSAYVAS